MDRGDQAMEEAINLWQTHHSSLGKENQLPESIHVQTRLVGLYALERSIHTFSHPEDAEILIEHVMHEVLAREARVCQLSRFYQDQHPNIFWNENAEELAAHSIRNVALIYVAASIYTCLLYTSRCV